LRGEHPEMLPSCAHGEACSPIMSHRTIEMESRALRSFIGCRRFDSEAVALPVCNRLCSHSDAQQVFIDSGKIPIGVDPMLSIDHAILNADVVLAVIGPKLSGLAVDNTRYRTDDAEDFVTRELRTALCRGESLNPLLLLGAGMPRLLDLLPATLRVSSPWQKSKAAENRRLPRNRPFKFSSLQEESAEDRRIGDFCRGQLARCNALQITPSSFESGLGRLFARLTRTTKPEAPCPCEVSRFWISGSTDQK